jgi:hypothetical protein
MAFPLGTLLLAAGAMAAVALLLRRIGGGGSEEVTMPPAEEPEPASVDTGPSHAEVLDEIEAEEADDLDPHAVLHVTSEGEVFLPEPTGVRVLPLGDVHAAVTAGHVSWDEISRQVLERRAGGQGLPGIGLDAGDFTAGRVVRGAPDADPWRLELLGRDGEYQPFAFETEDAAHGALALLQDRRVIQRPLDDDGAPIPVPPEEFTEARRRFEDTLEALAMSPEDEPPDDERR